MRKSLLLLLILFSLFLTCCSPPPANGEIQKGLHQYVDSFEERFGKEVKFIDIRYGNQGLDNDNDGTCTETTSYPEISRPDILIHPKYKRFQHASVTVEKLLVWHEIGHCKFGFGHVNGTKKKSAIKVTKSIMSPTIPTFEEYSKFPEYYHHQFQRMMEKEYER